MLDVNIQQDEQATQVEEVKEVVTEKSEGPKTEEIVETSDVMVEEPKLTPEQKFEKKKKTAQERINELTAEKYQLKKKVEELESKTKVGDSGIPQAPSPQKFVDEYGTFNEVEWNKSMADYQVKFSEWRESKKKQDQSLADKQEDEKRKVGLFAEQVGKVLEKYPDVHDIINRDVYSPVLRDILLDKAEDDKSEGTVNAVELSYYLGKNPNEAERINRMPPDKMLIELGRIEEKISSLTKKTSKAPEPINPIGGDKGLPQQKKPQDMTDDEWFIWRKEQIKKQIEGKK